MPIKILYIAYAFPPVNIVAAQRAMFQAKYMAEAGAEVTVICARQTSRRDDLSMMRFLEGVPRLMVHWIQPWGSTAKRSGFKPSAKGWFWVLRAYLLALRLHKAGPFNCIFSTFGPRYPHYLASSINRVTAVPWVAEFRDPWHGASHRAAPSAAEVAKEKKLLQEAACLVTVSEGFKAVLHNIHGKDKPVEVVYNGFEPAVYSKSEQLVQRGDATQQQKFKLLLAGTVYDFQMPSLELLLNALRLMPDVELEYVGSTFQAVQEAVLRCDAYDRVDVGGLVNHDVLCQKMEAADMAVLPVSRDFDGQLPVKFYDYLAAQKPVLMLGGAGTEVYELLKSTHSGINAETSEEVKACIDAFRQGQMHFDFSGVDFYTRAHQAQRLLELLKYASMP